MLMSPARESSAEAETRFTSNESSVSHRGQWSSTQAALRVLSALETLNSLVLEHRVDFEHRGQLAALFTRPSLSGYTKKYCERVRRYLWTVL